MVADFGGPATPTDKAQFARQVMSGSDDKEKGEGGGKKFHSMSITHAENGHVVEHRMKSKKTKGDGPGDFERTHEHKVLVPHGHAASKHIQALHEHCQSESSSCPDCE